MEVMQEGRLIYWNFVKWQFWGCKFRHLRKPLTLTQICEFLCRNALFCKVQSLFLRVNWNYERKPRKHDYYSLFLWHKKNNNNKQYASRGRSLPITYWIPFVPSQKCSHGSCRELRKCFLYPKYRHSSSWKNFFGKLTIFHEGVPRPHDEFMLCTGNEYLSRQSSYAMSVSTWWSSDLFEHGSWIDLQIRHF